MKSINSFIVLLFLFAPSAVFAAEEKEELQKRVYRLNQERRDTLIQTRQQIQAVRKALQLEALRRRNTLNREFGDLMSRFTVERFRKLESEAQWVALAFETDTTLLKRYYRLCETIIDKAALEPQSEMLKIKYKVAAKKGIDQAQVFRRELWQSVSIAYIRSLLEPDSEKAMADFRGYTAALRNIQEAEKFVMESEKMMLEAKLQLARDISSGVPYLGEAIDLLGAITGENLFTGEKLSGAQRTMDALLVIVPEALESLLANPAASRKLKDLTGKLAGISAKGAKRLAKALKKTPEQITALKKKLQRAFKKKYNALIADKLNDARKSGLLTASRRLDEMVEKTVKTFSRNAENLELNKIWKAAEKAGREKVEVFNRLLKNKDGALTPEKMLEAYQAIRKDKKALKHLQADEFKKLRTKMQKIENSILKKVDTDAISDIQKSLKKGVPDDDLARISAKPLDELTDADILKLKTAQAQKKIRSQIKKYGQKNGLSDTELNAMLDFENLEITVFNATNKAPRPDKIGFDRDITYQMVIPERIVNGRKISATKVDVPAELVEEHYQKALYKKLNPNKPLPGRKTLKEFGENMDHQVTDGLHKDAYRLGMDDITEFFKDPAKLSEVGSRVEDFSSTVTYKSKEWFERAARATDKAKAMTDVEEGMRQATKQYDNYMTKIMDHYGLDPATALPENFRNGMDVFKKVNDGTLSVPEAEAVLKALGTTKEQVIRQFGDKFEEIVKLSARKEIIKSGGKASKYIRYFSSRTGKEREKDGED